MATANESEEEGSNSMAICPACHCLYNNPRLLPCCHSICLECIEVTNTGLSKCPKCHNVSDQIPSDSCYDVTGDRLATVQRTRDELSKCSQILCSDCENETDATYFCITCSNPLCELDFKVHKKLYKNTHNLVSIDKISSIEQFYNCGSVHDCKFHPNTTADHFCTTCKCLLCSACLSHHHPDHKLSGLEEAIKRVSERSQACQNALEGLNTEGYQGAQHFLEKVIAMIADVEAKFDDLKKVLDDRKREVMDKLDYIYKDTLSVIQKGELQREHIQDLITKSKAYKTLPMNGQLLTDLESINSKVNELLTGLPVKTKYSYIDFTMDHDIKSIMKGLGCFMLEYAKEVLPGKIIETNTLASKYKFTPFTMSKDDQEKIYNLTTSCDVVVMNRAGVLLKKFKPSNMPSQINSGFIHWNKGLLYLVVGNVNSVTVCNEDGNLVKRFGKEGKKSGEFSNPLSIAVSNINGDIYVLEEGNHRVQVFNSTYIPNRFIGFYIEHPGQIKNPCELALTGEDHVIVAQRNIPSINIYNSQGIVLIQFGSSSINGHTFMPGAMCISHTGQLLLTDLLQDQIVVYDKDKLSMWTVGSPGVRRGEFSCPGGMVCMEDGTVYVCDMRNERIQVYSKDSMILGDN